MSNRALQITARRGEPPIEPSQPRLLTLISGRPEANNCVCPIRFASCRRDEYSFPPQKVSLIDPERQKEKELAGRMSSGLAVVDSQGHH